MNRGDFFKKLGLGGIALAIGSKVEIDGLSEDELYDKIINNIEIQTYDPDQALPIDKHFRTPSGHVFTPTQISDVVIHNLNDHINIFVKEDIFYQAHKLTNSAKEDLLWLLKNWDWSIHPYYQNRIYKSIGDCYLVEAKEKNLNLKLLVKAKEWFSKLPNEEYYTREIKNSYKLLNIEII
jgi:hypothetical protein